MGENELETVTRNSASPRTITGVSSGNNNTSYGKVWTPKPPLPLPIGEQRGIIYTLVRIIVLVILMQINKPTWTISLF
jgi:hypothetical protein